MVTEKHTGSEEAAKWQRRIKDVLDSDSEWQRRLDVAIMVAITAVAAAVAAITALIVKC